MHTIAIDRTMMTAWVLSLACGAMVSTGRAAEPQRWAVLIGVNDYVQLEDLQFPGKDVEALAARLAALGFPAKQVFTLHDGAKEKKQLPFKANVEQQLDLVLNLAGKDDLVLVAFSGHGMHIEGASYLCPTEANVDDPKSSMIDVEDVYSRLEKSPAALKLVVLDACRNDPRPAGKKSATAKEDGKKLAASFERPPDGIWLLASCGAGQVSYEDEELKQGVFMHFLLQGLAGKADGNKNGRVTLGELYDFASHETKLHVAHRWSDYQVPAQKGSLNGIFEFTPAGPIAGETITNTLGMKLVLIPSGEFEMGSHETPAELAAAFKGSQAPEFMDQRPLHAVRISQPFYLGQHEVTLGQFLKFHHDAKYKTDAEKDGRGGWGRTGSGWEQNPKFVPWSWGHASESKNHPVVNVSWNDATEFCQWLSRQEGRAYRLPTEAEWEYACRAGSAGRYFFGDDAEELARYANVADATYWAKDKLLGLPMIRASDGHAFTAPVGSYLPNAMGLFDMQGNASEWCADWYERDYYAGSPSNDPTGATSGSGRVIRGGCWMDLFPASYRCARRHFHRPGDRYNYTGFRVCQSVTTAP